MTTRRRAFAGAEVSLETVEGQPLRVSRWHWHHVSEGTGRHPPLVFFNGIGADLETFAPLARALDDRAVISWDMPGIGKSPAPGAPYSAGDVAATAVALLDRFGCDQADVMGLSWGGCMAQQLALDSPERVRKLVLAATGPGIGAIPGSQWHLSPLHMVPSLADAEFFAGYLPGPWQKLMAWPQPRLAAPRPPSVQGYSYQLLAVAGWQSSFALAFLRKPTLVLMGDVDAVVPVLNGHLLKGLIEGSRLEIIRGGGHLFLLSHIDESVQVLRDFLDAGAHGENAEPIAAD